MYTKYPRTYHLPWSLGRTNDDKVLKNTERLKEKFVVVTEKMDGENTTMYNDHIHARSIDSKRHQSRDWVKSFWAQRASRIPKDWRVCGENLFAKHSIAYEELDSYFLGFSIWDKDVCLSWDFTLEILNRLDITPVKELYRGIFDTDIITNLLLDENTQEGYVVRPIESFNISEFSKVVGKYVRPQHVQTDKHWMHQATVKNNLRRR